MKAKKFLALAAAVLTISCVPANVYADSLTVKDGLKYRISDSGEEKGLYTGWTKKGDAHYYYKDGVMKKNCWLNSKGTKKYFLQADGKRATGKVTIQGVEYEFDEKGVILPDEWGLTLTAKDVTPAGCTLVFTQSGGNPTGELNSGSPFTLERYKNGQWTEVEKIIQEFDWTDEGWIINNDTSTEFKHVWSDIYGELSAGKYRISKSVHDWRAPGDYDEKMYYAYFEISDKETSATSAAKKYPALTALTEEQENKLKEDFAAYRSHIWTDAKSEEMFIIHYYGTYNGSEVVVMWRSGYDTTSDLKEVTVGDRTFILESGSYEILLHKDSGFIDIKTAYSEGYLNDEDIETIYYYANNNQI